MPSFPRQPAEVSKPSSVRANLPLSKDDLIEAVREGDVRVLLMVLVHMTGDMRWLQPPFHPRRDVNLIPDPSAGLPAPVQDEIRQAIVDLFSSGNPSPAIGDPGDELMQHMMSVCLGEMVPPEYAAMTREEMGLLPRDVAWSDSPARADLAARKVLIVGAGVCGIALGVRLKALGIPFTIVEKNANIGGTWYGNRYPGCGVDTPNHSYSYSFSAKNRWSRYFSRREELQDYLERVAAEFDLLPHVELNTRVVSAQWDEARQAWTCGLDTGDGTRSIEAWTLVSAIGQLNDPLPPRIDGIDTFKGRIFHSAHWPEDLSVEGKHVSIIGTGATAMQLVPTVADRVASISVFQRSPQWSRPIPGYADEIGSGTQWLLEHLPFYAEWFRFNMFWRYGDGLLPFLRKDPDWPFPERAVNRANDRHRKELTEFILSELGGRQDLIDKSVPSYPPYGKRILLDNGWYRTLLKPNVHLVVDPIDRIEPGGTLTSDGVLHQADVIVLATGFKVTEMAARLNITGRGGLNLRTAWADDNPTAYLGLTVPQFPNFFCMLGPNTGPAHGGSVIFQAECQARYITSCLVGMIDAGVTSIDIRPEVVEEHVRKVDAEHEQLIWTHPGMSTYYRNANGRVFSAMPWRFVDYWAMTHDADLELYRQQR